MQFFGKFRRLMEKFSKLGLFLNSSVKKRLMYFGILIGTQVLLNFYCIYICSAKNTNERTYVEPIRLKYMVHSLFGAFVFFLSSFLFFLNKMKIFLLFYIKNDAFLLNFELFEKIITDKNIWGEKIVIFLTNVRARKIKRAIIQGWTLLLHYICV